MSNEKLPEFGAGYPLTNEEIERIVKKVEAGDLSDYDTSRVIEGKPRDTMD